MKNQLNIHLYVTDKCNLSCKHCYNSKWINTNSTNNLELQEVVDVISVLHKYYDVDFHIEGGETFLWQPIFDLLSKLDDNILKSITLTTNGTIPIAQYSYLLKNVNQLRISVCGHTDELQKMIRNISIKPISENIFLLVKQSVPLNIRMTLHKKNYKEILNSINYFSENNIKSISIYEYQNVGSGKINEDEFKLTNDNFIEFLISLTQFNTSNIESLKINLNKSRIKQIEFFRKRLEGIGLKTKILKEEPSLTINYNGEVGICPWVLGEDTLFNLRNGNYISNLEYLFANNVLYHDCNYCSAISIYKELR